MGRTFVGFGFGAIQAGLFLYEAFRSGAFDRLVVAEVMQDAVDAVRGGGGRYRLNVATRDGTESHEVSGVEIFNPQSEGDREALVDAVTSASEIATALPSVDLYGSGEVGDVAHILASGLRRKGETPTAPPAVIYTAENNNHAAEILLQALGDRVQGVGGDVFQCLNTVIGKMSGVVTESSQIAEGDLDTVAEGIERAFRVEEFNRILISRIDLPDFQRGIAAFDEKTDLIPFEEAKLYGHNATHALLGYLLHRRGAEFMAEASEDPGLMAFARAAFLEESGRALCRKHRGVDRLFTAEGYQEYVDDLLERMVNPHLRDGVERVTRDPRRKLGWDDRLIGTMRVVLAQGLDPRRYAVGAAVALRSVEKDEGREGAAILDEVWALTDGDVGEKDRLRRLVLNAKTVEYL